MGVTYNKTEGGSGGKRGHSNMTHHDKTEFIKVSCKKTRRVNDRKVNHAAKSGEYNETL